MLCTASPAQAGEPVILKLWPAKAPGETVEIAAEKQTEKEGVVTSITNVSEPTLKVYAAAKDSASGIGLLVAPGGGYNVLAWDHEGEQIAKWANSLGITAGILKYRVPRRPGTEKDQPPIGALQDAQRAMSIMRAKAGEWGIDPAKIGMLGFSAGGHLTAWTSTNFDKRSYQAFDDADKQSCRPDFAVIIYPGGTIVKDTFELKPEIRVSDKTPPSFIAMASDDRVNSDNCIALYNAMKKAGVPVEMHLYAKGGHGFGIRPTAGPAATWPKRCEEWMKVMGWVK
ncbi:alpha/beta hydrolase [Humisphaera borealis]|uniref:Alpha/beta hydrolase n=2 Tax=Humisphaera borealis TaxID=2807512 RepID=A0A7M2X6U4_9BACT|nr:alpha/beta hydrolase [Humisphaera borealis]